MEENSKETSCHIFSYGPNEVNSFAEKKSKLKDFILGPAIGKILETKAPGKRILDIGCGTGDWSYRAALCGAKSVDGFDKQDKMVELAKQATSQFNTVNIRVGDVMN